MKLFPKTVDSQFLVRVINNEVSPEEKEFFESWLLESDANKEEFGNFVLLWDKAGNARIPDPPDAKQQFDSIKNKLKNKTDQKYFNSPALYKPESESSPIVQLPAENLKVQYRKEFFLSILSWTGKAAAAVVVLFLTWYLIAHSNDQILVSPSSVASESRVTKVEKVTLRGEKSTVTLSDGTIVYLNSNSRLTYPTAFGGRTREVELIGEAYFSVAHDKTKPFLVHTGTTITEVVGTEFNLKFRSNKLNLVVAQGKVKAYRESSDNYVSLTKGMMTSFVADKGFSKPEKVNTKQYTAWRENKLSFVHAPLHEVMNEIEMYYNVQIIYANKAIKNKTLTGIFDADSLDHVLSMISLTMEMNICREGKKVIVN
ncbi:MAG: FecR domain-containing protein [Bacteroidota bacterium]|nr:FecR domain-containing protein [Bacteroidota bacterium]